MRSVVDHPEITTLFVVGTSEVRIPTIGGDTLYVPCNDDYSHLPQKTFWLAHWAADREFDFLFKCDDDTFIRIDRLMAMFREPLIWEYRGHSIQGGYASGGAGYMLGSRSVAQLANTRELKRMCGAEDLLVGRHLCSAGIGLLHDPRFGPWGAVLPEGDNQQITGHYVPPSKMIALYRSQMHAPSASSKPVET
jgi:hypothetical protein